LKRIKSKAEVMLGIGIAKVVPVGEKKNRF